MKMLGKELGYRQLIMNDNLSNCPVFYSDSYLNSNFISIRILVDM